MTQYYFVGNSLPPLKLGVKPEISFRELYDLLVMNLTPRDLQKVHELLWTIDLANIRALWRGDPLDEKGLYTPKELEEALLVREGFPDYMNDFLDTYESTADRLRYFPSLYASMYRDMEARETGFLLDYFRLEREIRLVLTGLRAKYLGRDLARELQFEDAGDDPFVMSILVQKDAPDYTPPQEYAELKQLFLSRMEEVKEGKRMLPGDPKDLHKALLEFRFNRLEVDEPFSIDRILSYVAQLLIIESWEALDYDKGNTLIEDLSTHG